MSKKGCSPDNSAYEGFFGRAYINKTEKLNAPHFTTFSENNLLITAWVKILQERLELSL